MRIETERLIIRKFNEEDALSMHSLFIDDEAMRFVALYPPLKSIEETKERIKEWINDDEHYALELKDNHNVVGYIAINPDSEEEREDTRELGFAMINDYRRNGYMKEAIITVLNELKNDNIKYVWACCFNGNDASKYLIESLNFKLINIGTFIVDNDREYKSYEYRIML